MLVRIHFPSQTLDQIHTVQVLYILDSLMNLVTRRTTNFYVENYIEDSALPLKIPTVHERRILSIKQRLQ